MMIQMIRRIGYQPMPRGIQSNCSMPRGPHRLHPHAAAHAGHAHGTAADGAFPQAAGDEAGLGKIAGVFQAELVVQVHRLVADRSGGT